MTLRLVASAVFVAGALAAQPAAAAGKLSTAARYDVRLSLGPDGSLEVAEDITMRFQGGPFTSLTRTLPRRTYDGVVDIAAAMDGTVLSAGRGPGQIEVRRGDDGRTVTWRFLAIADSTHTFTLSYTVRGVVERRAGEDRLTWMPVPARRDFPIEAVAVQLTWPAGAVLAGGPAATLGSVLVAGDRRSATFEAAGLGRRQTVELTVAFAPATAASVPPDWQVRRDQARAMAVPSAIGGATIVLAGVAWLLLFWNSHRREPTDGRPPARDMTPPGELPVALAAAIQSPGGGGSWPHALAALLDLAGRGVVRIEETPERILGRPRDYVMSLVNPGAELRPHERGLIELLFRAKGEPSTSVKLSAAGRAAQSRLKVFQRPLGEDLVAAGLVSPEHARTRAALVRGGLLLVLAGGIGFAVAAVLAREYGPWPLLVPGSLTGIGVAVLIMASQYSVLTTSGRLQAAEWASFFRSLHDVAKGRRPITEPAWFEAYLPHAAARNQGPQWARAFDRSGKVARAPAWFVPAGGPERSALGRLADMLSRAQTAGVHQQHAH